MSAACREGAGLPRGPDRRRLLQLAGAALACAPPSRSETLPARGRRDATDAAFRLIDVHHHILPPGAPPPLVKLAGGWSPETDLAGMDAAGVATAMALPGLLLGPDLQTNRRLAREWNEFGAALGREHRGRFGLFACLPMTDTEGAVAEIDHALDQLHADGFGIATNYGEAWLGDPRFTPVLEHLNARRAVVFVHPVDAPCCTPAKTTYGVEGMDGSWMEWPMNTARTIFSLLASGTTRRLPNIRFIFAHGGGVMPLLAPRVAALAYWKHVGPERLRELFPDGIEAEFARLHFECAQACAPANMAALRSLVPDSQILFGSDTPFFSAPYAAGKFRALNLPAATLRAIARGNAQGLLPRWA